MTRCGNWPRSARWRARPEVILLRGMEVTTDMGHIGVFGLKTYLGGIYELSELRRVADKSGAILIANLLPL